MTGIETREDLEFKAFYAFDEFKRADFPIHKKDLEQIAEAGLISKEDAKAYSEAYQQIVMSTEAASTMREDNGETHYTRLYAKCGLALGIITCITLYYLTGNIDDLCCLAGISIITTGGALAIGDRFDKENKELAQELPVNYRQYKHYLAKISNINFKEAEQKCTPETLERAKKHFEFYTKLLEEAK